MYTYTLGFYSLNPQSPGTSSVLYLGFQLAIKNLFKEIESVSSNAPDRGTRIKQMLVWSDEKYLQNEKLKRSLYNHLIRNKTK